MAVSGDDCNSLCGGKFRRSLAVHRAAGAADSTRGLPGEIWPVVGTPIGAAEWQDRSGDRQAPRPGSGFRVLGAPRVAGENLPRDEEASDLAFDLGHGAVVTQERFGRPIGNGKSEVFHFCQSGHIGFGRGSQSGFTAMQIR